jgi:2-polyprenyl-3-methyl-5-hydroxy-6-metoxy-1,4-benzoquinol methylase
LLDAGCGDGYWLARLSNIDDLDLTGADFNPVRVERARQVVPQAHILHRDLANLKTEEPFDIILLNQVVEHVKDDDGLLHAMREMLRPGGTLILGTPNEGSALQRWSRLRKGTSFQTDHVHFYAETQIRRKILRAGFVIDSVMHEAFYVGSDRLYYSMTKRKWGFKLLQLMSRLLPSQCSDFYFECRLP